MNFEESVKNVVRKIPKGRILSYKEVAEKIGNPKAYRAVATVMKNNYDPDVPCHRVIKSNGTVGEYNRGGAKTKRSLLLGEGVQIK